MESGSAQGRSRTILRKEESAALLPEVVGLAGSEMASCVNAQVVAAHAEEAAFLWTQRVLASEQPNYNLSYLARLDERIDAHLDGLVTAGNSGREACSVLLESDEPGAFFADCTVDQLGTVPSRLQSLAELALGNGVRHQEFAASCRWLGPEHVAHALPGMCRVSEPELRVIALFAAAEARIDLDRDGAPVLAACVRDVDVRVRAYARYAAGVLQQHRLRSDLEAIGQETCGQLSEQEQFLAAYGGGLMGIRTDLDYLRCVVRNPLDSRTLRGLQVLMTQLPERELRVVLNELRESTPSVGMIATGMLGQPQEIEQIFAALTDESLSRLAGEAYATITGADLELQSLDGESLLGEDDAEADKLLLSYQTHLPWPNATAISKHWSSMQGQLVARQRYLCGLPVPAGCSAVLAQGYQRQRALAALHLAGRTDAPVLFDVRAPVRRQAARLRA